jgi:hypothetical protein
VVDRHFVERLEGALKRKVKVWIGYGMGKHGSIVLKLVTIRVTIAPVPMSFIDRLE